MDWIIGTMIMAIVIAVVFAILASVKFEKDDGGFIAVSRSSAALIGLGIFVLAGGLFTFAMSIHQVEAGQVGVVYRFGEIVDQTGEGLVLTAPYESVKNADIRVQRHTFEGITAASFETQDVRFQITLNYRVSPEDIQFLYRNVGTKYFDTLVPSRLDQILKDESVQYSAIEITQKRDEIRDTVSRRLGAELAAYSVEIVSLQIDNIDYSQAFNESIERKQVATQDALEAKERIEQAKNEAQSAIEKARGLAEATRLEAEGQAAANDLLNASLTPSLIQWQAVQRLSDNIQIALIPSGEGIIIDPATILSGE